MIDLMVSGKILNIKLFDYYIILNYSNEYKFTINILLYARKIIVDGFQFNKILDIFSADI